MLAGLKRTGQFAMGATTVCAVCLALLNVHVLFETRGAISQEVASAPLSVWAIVLGSGVNLDGTTNVPVEERLKTAYELYVRGRVRRILVTGLTCGRYNESRAMAAWLFARGVPHSDVAVDGAGYRTAASIANAARLGGEPILIVSQGYHLARAIYLAQHAGLSARGVAAPLESLDVRSALYMFVREAAARAEAVLEVAVRGVRSGTQPGCLVAEGDEGQ